MRKMKKKGIKIVALALASFLMLVFCIIAASPDSTLCFIDPTPANYTQEQDFTWGVLAINTHKSIYLPNEAASISIAVLDNEGHMVCDADVTLTIADPSDNETVLSTSNGLIKVSPECSVYGVTNLQDYYTNYEVGGVGTYVMNLTAVTADGTGTKSITDEFTVQNSVDFDVARDGPTRIYPPVPYVMNFTIKANKNYTGLIKEYVPASFDITPQDGLIVTTVGDTKILTWNKKLAKGETYNIAYEFDAPDISPYLFILGELEIGAWQEARNWQIASDKDSPIVWTIPDDPCGSGEEGADIDIVISVSCGTGDGCQGTMILRYDPDAGGCSVTQPVVGSCEVDKIAVTGWSTGPTQCTTLSGSGTTVIYNCTAGDSGTITATIVGCSNTGGNAYELGTFSSPTLGKATESCGDPLSIIRPAPPSVVLIHPWGYSCAEHYHDEDSDVDITVNVTDVTGVDTILANITFPNQTSINLSGFDYGLQSDDFDTDTENVNWVHANSTLATGQSCYTDIHETVSGKMFIALDGGGTEPGMHCAFNSIKRANGNYDLNLSFNVTHMEDDTFFTLRSAPTDSMSASGLRVYMSLIQNSEGDRAYRFAYYNGTGSTVSYDNTTTDTSGKFRIKRSNMTGTPEFNLYYWDNNGNDWIESDYGPISIPGCSRIHFIQIKPGSSASNYGALNVTIDDFQISGDNYTFAIFNQTHDNGTYNVTIIANDTLGYVNDTINSSFEIEYINDPPSRPYFEEPDAGDAVTGLFNISWGQVTDDENDNVRFNITLLNSDGSFNSTIVSNYGDINTQKYQWDTTNPFDGLYSMNITVYENESAKGLSTLETLAGNFTIDNYSPPAISIDEPTEASPVYKKGGELFYVNFTYTDASPANYTVKIYNSSATINTTGVVEYPAGGTDRVASKSFNLNSTAADGWYNVSVEMYDNASNYRISYQNNSVVKVTWESYKEEAHTNVWGQDVAHAYNSEFHIVYMHGEGFKLNNEYKVAYYDANDWKAQTDFTNSSDGTGALGSQYDFTSNVSSAAGIWHCVVLNTTGSAPNTYAAAIADANYTVDDDFEVVQAAIPEFSTVIAAIAVCLLCAVAYVVMRRRAEKG